MNEFRKNGIIKIVIVIFIVIFIVAGIIIYIDKKESNDVEVINDEISLCIDLSSLKGYTDSNDLLDAVSYYRIYHASLDDTYYEESLYKNGSLLIGEMNDDIKFTIALDMTNYWDLISDDTSCNIGEYPYIDEEVMEKAFEIAYGTGIYKQVDEVTIGCIPYEYDSDSKRYVATSTGCGGESIEGITESIIDTTQTNDTLFITTSVLYGKTVDNEDDIDFIYYKDYDKTIMVSSGDIDSYDDDISYITDNYNDLEQYTYTFKIVNNSYIYQGVTRTNSVN